MLAKLVKQDWIQVLKTMTQPSGISREIVSFLRLLRSQISAQSPLFTTLSSYKQDSKIRED